MSIQFQLRVTEQYETRGKLIFRGKGNEGGNGEREKAKKKFEFLFLFYCFWLSKPRETSE